MPRLINRGIIRSSDTKLSKKMDGILKSIVLLGGVFQPDGLYRAVLQRVVNITVANRNNRKRGAGPESRYLIVQ